jgi:hypothetical protein
MQTQKRTYALPQATIEKFEQTVVSGQRSATLSRLIEDWLEKQRWDALEKDVIEGCREMADVYLEIQREFDPLDTEVTRGYYPG